MICSICLNNLTDPVAPPCGHVVCNKCLQKHIERSSQPDSETPGILRTPCPTCNALFRSSSSDGAGENSTDIRRIHIDTEEPVECKLLLLGESSVGKSSLLQRFSDEHWMPGAAAATVGIDYRLVKLKVRGRTIKLSIWDTGGQERYRASITPSYYRKAQGIILVYDISDKKTFDALPRWYSELKQHVGPSVVKIIVGNKLDREHSRQVSTADGQAFAKCVDSLFIETSATTAAGVVEAFGQVVSEILDTPELLKPPGQSDSGSGASVKLEAKPVAAAKRCRC